MLKHWKQLSKTIRFKNPWWTYKVDTFQIPDGVSGEYHYVYTRGSSMVVPVNSEGKILLVNQYRYLCDKESLEFPCGSINEGSDYVKTAYHELAEETGFKAGSMIEAGHFNPYNGVTSEICHVYLGTDLTATQSKPDETEEFELHTVTFEELEHLISSNKIWDGMTLAAWMLARPKIIELLRS